MAEPASIADNVVLPEGNQPGFIQSTINKITNNKKYLYIGITVIILGCVLYYLYKKNKKENMKNINLGELNNQEYFVLDSNGNPKKVALVNQQLPIQTQQPSQQEIMMLQKQMMEKQQQTRPKIKLEHPKTDNQESEDINDELARIQANEDENVTVHNLTNSELAEINKKLEMMNNKQN